MVGELRALLDALPATATQSDYRAAIIEGNVLGKKTLATRRLTARYLVELYALNDQVVLFRVLRRLWDADQEGRPLLALLCALARDPILKMTADPVLTSPRGQVVAREDLEAAVAAAAPGRYSPASLASIGRNAASSWTQSGHLTGLRVKRRHNPVATPANVAYALFLGYLGGARGQLLMDTSWTRLLDVSVDRLAALASKAARRGWIDFLHAGSVVEVRFPVLLTLGEREALRGED